MYIIAASSGNLCHGVFAVLLVQTLVNIDACADPMTVAWLQANVDNVFGYPQIVRFSWQTTTRLLEESACGVQW